MRSRALTLSLVCLLTTGCGQGDSTGAQSPDSQSTDGDDGLHAGEQTLPEGWYKAPSHCDPPALLGEDPLTLVASEPNFAIHMLDLAHDPRTKRIYAAGSPGLVVYEYTDGELVALGKHPTVNSDQSRFYHIEIIDPNTVTLSTRGKTFDDGLPSSESGFIMFDVSNPKQPTPSFPMTRAIGAGDMTRSGDLLYLLCHNGMLRTFYVQPGTVNALNQTDGLANPWEMVLVGNRGYVADAVLGVVVVELDDPEQPVIGASVATLGAAQDIDHRNGTLYVAAGASGVQLFSLDDPDSPTPLSHLELGGAVISVSVDPSGFLWTTNRERVHLVDARDELTPISVATEPTNSWAMDVLALDGFAFVADWDKVSTYGYVAGVSAPDAEISVSALYFIGGETEQSFSITNRGTQELTIDGIMAWDDRVSVRLDRLTVAPGEAGSAVVTLSPANKSVNTSLCIATNDPDMPQQQIPLSTHSLGTSVLLGEEAPNFTLLDIHGEQLELAEELGHPILLLFFSTW